MKKRDIIRRFDESATNNHIAMGDLEGRTIEQCKADSWYREVYQKASILRLALEKVNSVFKEQDVSVGMAKASVTSNGLNRFVYAIRRGGKIMWCCRIGKSDTDLSTDEEKFYGMFDDGRVPGDFWRSPKDTVFEDGTEGLTARISNLVKEAKGKEAEDRESAENGRGEVYVGAYSEKMRPVMEQVVQSMLKKRNHADIGSKKECSFIPPVDFLRQVAEIKRKASEQGRDVKLVSAEKAFLAYTRGRMVKLVADRCEGELVDLLEGFSAEDWTKVALRVLRRTQIWTKQVNQDSRQQKRMNTQASFGLISQVCAAVAKNSKGNYKLRTVDGDYFRTWNNALSEVEGVSDPLNPNIDLSGVYGKVGEFLESTTKDGVKVRDVLTKGFTSVEESEIETLFGGNDVVDVTGNETIDRMTYMIIAGALYQALIDTEVNYFIYEKDLKGGAAPAGETEEQRAKRLGILEESKAELVSKAGSDVVGKGFVLAGSGNSKRIELRGQLMTVLDAVGNAILAKRDSIGGEPLKRARRKALSSWMSKPKEKVFMTIRLLFDESFRRENRKLITRTVSGYAKGVSNDFAKNFSKGIETGAKMVVAGAIFGDGLVDFDEETIVPGVGDTKVEIRNAIVERVIGEVYGSDQVEFISPDAPDGRIGSGIGIVGYVRHGMYLRTRSGQDSRRSTYGRFKFIMSLCPDGETACDDIESAFSVGMQDRAATIMKSFVTEHKQDIKNVISSFMQEKVQMTFEKKKQAIGKYIEEFIKKARTKAGGEKNGSNGVDAVLKNYLSSAENMLDDTERILSDKDGGLIKSIGKGEVETFKALTEKLKSVCESLYFPVIVTARSAYVVGTGGEDFGSERKRRNVMRAMKAIVGLVQKQGSADAIGSFLGDEVRCVVNGAETTVAKSDVDIAGTAKNVLRAKVFTSDEEDVKQLFEGATDPDAKGLVRAIAEGFGIQLAQKDLSGSKLSEKITVQKTAEINAMSAVPTVMAKAIAACIEKSPSLVVCMDVTSLQTAQNSARAVTRCILSALNESEALYDGSDAAGTIGADADPDIADALADIEEVAEDILDILAGADAKTVEGAGKIKACELICRAMSQIEGLIRNI